MFRRGITCCLTVAALLSLVGCRTVYMKATPFYTGEYEKTEGPAEKRVNVWPLLYYRKPALSVLWPLGEVTDDHVAARPLVAVYKLDKDERQWRFLWPLAQFDFDTDRHRVFPVFWWDGGFTVFPLVWYGRDDHCHLFPLWMHSKGSGGHDTWALWPIFRLKQEENEQGFHVWPLVGSYKEEDSSYNFAVWPLCQRWRDGEDSLLLTPVWSSRTEGDSRWNCLFPLYYTSTDTSKDEERLITLLVGRTRSGDRIRWMVVPAASSVAWGEDEKDIWALAPLAHFRWGGDNVQSHVAPLYLYDRDENLFVSPVFSRRKGDDDGFVNLLTFLGQYTYHSDGQRTLRVLPPLTGVSWGGGRRRIGAWLFSYFAPEARAEQDKPHYLWIAPSIYWERDFGEREWSEDPDGNGWTGEWHRKGFFPLWHYQSHEDPEGERRYRDFSLLGFLYDYRLRQGRPARDDSERTEDYVRGRLLWRLAHYERIDGDKTLDIFPAITWDSKADGYRQFSFMWRLFRIERTEDGGQNLDLLFIPLMRKSGTVEGGTG
jgi:hypothetical protein